MNQELIVLELNQWMMSFVEQPNPRLGHWAPCPFARQARIANKIEIVFADIGDLYETINASAKSLESRDVVIICFDHNMISPEKLQEFVTYTNNSIMPRDLVVLEDHPDIPEYVNGVKMNFGQCGLLLVQQLSKLNDASKQLKSKGYYDSWSEKNIDNVVNWRDNEVLQNQFI